MNSKHDAIVAGLVNDVRRMNDDELRRLVTLVDGELGVWMLMRNEAVIELRRRGEAEE